MVHIPPPVAMVILKDGLHSDSAACQDLWSFFEAALLAVRPNFLWHSVMLRANQRKSYCRSFSFVSLKLAPKAEMKLINFDANLGTNFH